MEFFVQRQDFAYKRYAGWFDSQLKAVFDIDVFSSEFPKEKGYHIYRGERADLLLIRLENLNDCYRETFKEFLGIQDFRLINVNRAQDKAYYPVYRDFIENADLPADFVDKMLASEYARHFYSPEEIAGFRAKWTRGGLK